MSRGSWLVYVAGGLLAGLLSVSMAPGLVFAWLTVWPVAFLAEWIRNRVSGIVFGYFVSVGTRMVMGLGMAIVFDRLLNHELGVNRVYWFGWLANYIVALIAEIVLVLLSSNRTGNRIA